VLIAALIGGAGAGTFAALLGGIISWWAFLPPHYSFLPLTAGQQISLLSYVFASLLIVWAADHYRRLMNQLEDEEKFRKLAVHELAVGVPQYPHDRSYAANSDCDQPIDFRADGAFRSAQLPAMPEPSTNPRSPVTFGSVEKPLWSYRQVRRASARWLCVD
jgi:hypothetical protein